MNINDLPDVGPDLNVHMYVDETVIFTHGLNIDIISFKLTNTLNKVQDWLDNNFYPSLWPTLSYSTGEMLNKSGPSSQSMLQNQISTA